MTSRKKFIKHTAALIAGSSIGIEPLLKAATIANKFNNPNSNQQIGFITNAPNQSTFDSPLVFTQTKTGWECSSDRSTIFRKKKRRITILHTNDFHSRFEPFEPQNSRWGNQGGIARMKDIIDRERNNDPNVFLFDSGDVFQGTPYFNVFKGHPELEWMNKANYDATTLGNHDFDLGIEHLFQIRKQYNTPTLNCNYQIDQNLNHTNPIQPYKIIVKNGVKLGIMGVGIDLKGLLSEDSFKGVTYTDPIESVQKIANHLKMEEKCDMIVILSHLGYKYENDKIDDLKLASRTKNVDVILGGHTHTFLDKPSIVKNLEGKKVIVNQAGWAGLRLGKLVFDFK